MTSQNAPASDIERGHWEAAADAWGRWADAMAAMADKLNQPLLDAVGVCAGARVLDLAGGAGEPAFSSANRVGEGGLSVCTDLATGMLTGAAARGRSAGAANIVVAGADMCALPLAGARFDAAACRVGVTFVPDVALALAEARRVLRPGGKAGFMVWGPLNDNALLAGIDAALESVLNAPSPQAGVEGLFRFAEPDSLARLLRIAGFSKVTEQEIRVTRRARLSEGFWRAPLEMSFAHRLDGLQPDARAAAEQAVADWFGKRADADGTVALPLHARVIAGQN